MVQPVPPSAALGGVVWPGYRAPGLPGCRVVWGRRVGVSGWVVWPGRRVTGLGGRAWCDRRTVGLG